MKNDQKEEFPIPDTFDEEALEKSIAATTSGQQALFKKVKKSTCSYCLRRDLTYVLQISTTCQHFYCPHCLLQ